MPITINGCKTCGRRVKTHWEGLCEEWFICCVNCKDAVVHGWNRTWVINEWNEDNPVEDSNAD